jgi:hypothetical protein
MYNYSDLSDSKVYAVRRGESTHVSEGARRLEILECGKVTKKTMGIEGPLTEFSIPPFVQQPP